MKLYVIEKLHHNPFQFAIACILARIFTPGSSGDPAWCFLVFFSRSRALIFLAFLLLSLRSLLLTLVHGFLPPPLWLTSATISITSAVCGWPDNRKLSANCGLLFWWVSLDLLASSGSLGSLDFLCLCRSPALRSGVNIFYQAPWVSFSFDIYGKVSHNKWTEFNPKIYHLYCSVM